MTGVPKRSVATAPFLVGTFLFLCALTFYYFAVLEIDYQKTTLLNLGPYPDAVEYFAQAKAILKDGWPSIQIGYDKLPSRYPFGYPALMLPWLKILPEADSILAPFRTNQTIGLFLLFGVFGFYLCLAKPLAGGCTTLLLATLPGFFTYCRSSMSEISMSALIVLAFMFAYLGLTEERRWKIYLSAVLLGLSVNIRTQSIFFAPLLLAMVLFPAKGTWLRWSLHCATVPIVFALAASPMLLMNTIQFHSPLKSGYNFWSPYWLEHHRLFSQRYVVINLTHLWKELTLQPVEFTVANIFGTGTVIVPAFMLLVCVGFFFHSRQPICCLLAFSWPKFFRGDGGLQIFPGTALPPAASSAGSCGGCVCQVGGKEPIRTKTDHRRHRHFGSVRRSLRGLSFALRLQHGQSQSIADGGRSPL